jgi:16S rRNA (cytosine1402-N4)-methyltransferase
MTHIPVLLQPCIDSLAVKKDGGVYVDGTLGGGGHARAILSLMQSGRYIGIDKDEVVLVSTRDALVAEFPHIQIDCVVGGFENISTICAELGVDAVDGVLLDLGWGSHTMDNGRGFSFQKDEPLVMTYATPRVDSITAETMVNEWSWETLTTIFKGWGEEPRAYKVAQAIVETREIAPIRTTGQLVKIIESVVPRIGKVHPATRVFQALRIAVNREIEILQPACTDALSLLVSHGRLCVITFHSGEDRVMKQLFNEWADADYGEHLTRKVIQAEREEKLGNPRARSAKLRVFEKV